MVPSLPTTTKILFPEVTFSKLFVVPEVLEVQVIASGEVSRVPEAPTATNNPPELELLLVELSLLLVLVELSLLLSSSSSLAQEITVRLKIDIRIK